MSFKFNFFAQEDPIESDKKHVPEKEEISSPKVKTISYEPSSVNLLFQQWNKLTIHDVTYEYLKNADPASNNSIAEVSDLVPNVYEGGYEVWECTIDLLNYLHSHIEILKQSSSVLDLGCGAGLLGIAAKMASSDHVLVVFQDYNFDVIENFTLKNYHKNCGGSSSTHNVKFIAGDWSEMSGKLCKYDLILSAETIYNCKSQQKVLKILLDHLSDSGTAYFASKRHYFGVGGGVVDFKTLVAGSNCFKCESVWSNETGLLRDILKITRI